MTTIEIENRKAIALPVKPGDAIVYTDQVGKRHNALVTVVHGSFYEGALWTEDEVREAWKDCSDEQVKMMEGTAHYVPCINLVFVTADESKTDPYGRQIARETSCQHRSQTTAHGFYWENA